ncbi:MAG: cysteine dioxygenase family protein [Flavobacteriales bacterium]
MPTKQIRTVEELIKALEKEPGTGGYLSILERADIPSELFGEYCTWHDKHYTRNCIARTNEFELLVICYEPGQSTSIHDYNTQEAWVHPIMGSVVEERFEPPTDGGLRKVSSAKLVTDSFSYLHNGRSIHRYINNTEERAATLNLYARPLIKWKVYDERSGEPRIDTPDG